MENKKDLESLVRIYKATGDDSLTFKRIFKLSNTIIKSFVKRRLSRQWGMYYDDIVQDCLIKLQEWILVYDPEKTRTFETFLLYRCNYTLLDGLTLYRQGAGNAVVHSLSDYEETSLEPPTQINTAITFTADCEFINKAIVALKISGFSLLEISEKLALPYWKVCELYKEIKNQGSSGIVLHGLG